MARQTELDRHWHSLMSLCTRERDYKVSNRHPKLLRLVTEQINDLAAQMGFSRRQISSREFRAEKDGDRISKLLVDKS